MTSVSPDLGSILIVLGFLGALLLLRQVVLARAGAIKARLGVAQKPIEVLCTQRLDKQSQLSLVEIEGARIVVVHGARGQAAMLHMGRAAPDSSIVDTHKGHGDA